MVESVLVMLSPAFCDLQYLSESLNCALVRCIKIYTGPDRGLPRYDHSYGEICKYVFFCQEQGSV